MAEARSRGRTPTLGTVNISNVAQMVLQIDNPDGRSGKQVINRRAGPRVL
eukprot:CAMPEP_0172082398 /NCGR_PEP_ID=MMETSP1043-20130122/19844_1 /TAXON_ID=464988 /ORGANISM="Hemiselmis andersenii, Strain CCMP441" /LENGTH=49 /DNA_ID= /DNA_START= /DNA_END= /DNA_ORIENTATION=